MFVLLALAFGLLLAAIVTEVAFRMLWQLPPQLGLFEQTGLFVEMEDGSTSFTPGYQGVLKAGEELTATVRINALGMRGEDLAPRRPGERRVLMVGDSLVFGYGVEQDDTLPAALGRALGGAVVVGNGGVPGLGTRATAARLENLAPRFDADAFVFCSFLGNDAVDDLRLDVAICNGLRFEGHMARLARESLRFRLAVHSRALLWFETWIFNNKPAWSPLGRIRPNPEEMRVMAGLPGTYPEFGKAFAGIFLDVADDGRSWGESPAPIIPRIVANVRASLQRAKAIAAGRPLVFVVLPTLWQVDENRRQEKLRALGFAAAEFPRGTAQGRWLEVARSLDLPAVDATAA
ncbi:MAG: hypothetical protein KDC98_04340, partial [Planctomycetes bacterium]|nr:hypothetical protein [Planctomycetota bacterium]